VIAALIIDGLVARSPRFPPPARPSRGDIFGLVAPTTNSSSTCSVPDLRVAVLVPRRSAGEATGAPVEVRAAHYRRRVDARRRPGSPHPTGSGEANPGRRDSANPRPQIRPPCTRRSGRPIASTEKTRCHPAPGFGKHIEACESGRKTRARRPAYPGPSRRPGSHSPSTRPRKPPAAVGPCADGRYQQIGAGTSRSASGRRAPSRATRQCVDAGAERLSPSRHR